MDIEKDIREAVIKYSDMLYKVCIVILCNEQDVQDAIQDTFCRYLKKKPEFCDEEHKKAWLIKVATNICRDMIRFRIRHPKVSIHEVENTLAAPEGALCYIRSTGVFNLPAQELTDEELLEIIDLQHKMSYAVAHGPQAQSAREESQEKEARLKKELQDAGGMSEEEVLEIAKKQLETDLGDAAGGLEMMTDNLGKGVFLMDALDYSEVELERESKAGVIYDVGFGNPDTHFTYGYLIDVVDGSILYTYSSESSK